MNKCMCVAIRCHYDSGIFTTTNSTHLTVESLFNLLFFAWLATSILILACSLTCNFCVTNHKFRGINGRRLLNFSVQQMPDRTRMHVADTVSVCSCKSFNWKQLQVPQIKCSPRHSLEGVSLEKPLMCFDISHTDHLTAYLHVDSFAYFLTTVTKYHKTDFFQHLIKYNCIYTPLYTQSVMCVN